MGLDMYAYNADPEKISGRSSIKPIGDVDLEQLFYWRKHHDLHGWMEKLYRSRGGLEESFNCIKIRLYEADLQALEDSVKGNALPQTTGFFFGNFPPDAESQAEDLEFIRKARAAIADGKAVLYDSWW